jgi:uncharacterized protein (DUF697 family)
MFGITWKRRAAAHASAVEETGGGEAPRALPPTSGAEVIVRKWTRWSAGFGLVPIPLVDLAATTACSLKMLHSLAKYYDVPFRPELGKSAVSSLLAGASAPVLALTAGSALKGIPFLGVPLGIASGSLIAGGITYGIGRVFTAHFGSGGTFLDFDPETFRAYFQEQVEAGKTLVNQRTPPERAR